MMGMIKRTRTGLLRCYFMCLHVYAMFIDVGESHKTDPRGNVINFVSKGDEKCKFPYNWLSKITG